MKITATEFNNIFGTHKSNALEFTMTKDNNGFHFEERVKPWLFALLFLPVVVCQFFYLLWDGGLQEFSLPDNYSIDAGSLWLADKQYITEKWEKAEKLWKRA
jgi:hypothetical protein